MLKSIQLTGFKSFAKKDSLSFESPITAIVGPNGSGKSNTAEAFRFVLGEQGGKAMRIKKGTDLIWGGSHTLPKGSRAGVRVVLDNTDNKLAVDFNEVIIERSVLRDGTNEYTINGSKVRLKDVQNLLAGANIGSSGHHIISQGQADRVLGATPKERREMLEDALGLKSYILKKAEAERKLSATSQNLEKAQSNTRELLPHLNFLKKQAEAAAAAKDTRLELERKASEYFTNEKLFITIKGAEVSDSINRPASELKAVEQKVSELRGALQKAKLLNSEQGDIKNDEILKELQSRAKLAKLGIASSRQEQGKILGQLEMLEAIESKQAQRPVSIPREGVREILNKVVEELEMAEETNDKATIASIIIRARKVAEQFISKVLDAKPNTVEKEASAAERATLLQSKQEVDSALQEQEQELAAIEQDVSEVEQGQVRHKQESTELERDLYKETAAYNELTATVEELHRQEDGLQRRATLLQENFKEVQALLGVDIEIGEPKEGTLTEAYDNKASELARKELERLKIKIEQHGPVGIEAVDEYKEAREQYDFLSQQIVDLQAASSKLSELVSSLELMMRGKFNDGLELINKEFNNFFNGLFRGGSASLTLDKSTSCDDPDVNHEIKEGIVVSVKLPRKKVTVLETLSGGERALASIALIFAMSQVNPPPFIILDETDAALDEANSQRYAQIVRQLSAKSQIILITHNRATMSAADTLYGVTMGGDGVSKLLSVKLTEAEQFAK